MMTPCSVSLMSFGTSVRQALDWAGRSSASAVELEGRRQLRPAELGTTARRQIRHLLSERSLKTSGLLFPSPGGIADLDRLADRIEAAREAMQLAFDIGAKALVVPFVVPTGSNKPAGSKPDPGLLAFGGQSNETAIEPLPDAENDRVRDVLRVLSEFGDRVGCRLTLRTGAEAGQLVELISPVASAPIDVQFDPAACVLSGEPIEANMRILGERIRQLRLIDTVRSSSKFGHETTMGRGEVDFDLLAALTADLRLDAAVVSPDDPNVAPLETGLEFASAVFGGKG